MVSCHTHIIGQTKRYLSKFNNSQKHFALRLVGRMIRCFSLEELTLLVKNMFVVMNNKYVTGYVNKSLDVINEMINDFSGLEGTFTDVKEDDCLDCEEIVTPEGGVGSDGSPWKTYWYKCIESLKEDGHLDTSMNNTIENEVATREHVKGPVVSEQIINKYNMRSFLTYFCKTMLPDVDFWTKLCFADMSNYGSVYRTFLKEQNTCGKNIRISNTANAPVENILKFIKNDKFHW